MRGRARARPDHETQTADHAALVASMRGRARARPDRTVTAADAAKAACFNEGAGTCPPGPGWATHGRSTSQRFNEGAGTCPPGPQIIRRSPATRPGFNEGAGTCPPGPLASFGGGYLLVRGRLRAVLEADASKGRDSVVKEHFAFATRIRAVLGGSHLNLALASDDRGS